MGSSKYPCFISYSSPQLASVRTKSGLRRVLPDQTPEGGPPKRSLIIRFMETPAFSYCHPLPMDSSMNCCPRKVWTAVPNGPETVYSPSRADAAGLVCPTALSAPNPELDCRCDPSVPSFSSHLGFSPPESRAFGISLRCVSTSLIVVEIRIASFPPGGVLTKLPRLLKSTGSRIFGCRDFYVSAKRFAESQDFRRFGFPVLPANSPAARRRLNSTKSTARIYRRFDRRCVLSQPSF